MTHIDKRISHYCHRLGLTSWDIKDILVWFNTDRATNDPNEQKRFQKACQNLSELGYMPMVKRFYEYLMKEKELMEKYKVVYPHLTTDEIVNIINKEIDEDITRDIAEAKHAAKYSLEGHNARVRRNNSIYSIIMWLIAIGLVIFIMSNC